mgnify:CR=1 FL=1
MNENQIHIGTVINELEILSYSTKPDTDKYKDYGGPWVRCKCSCGNEIIAPLYGIKQGFIKSCGHLKGQQGGKTLQEYYETHEPVNATYLTVDGETRNISEWSRITGIPRTTLLYRINKKMPIEKVFSKEISEDETASGD